jgi:AcrR family transcriptional regulator
MIRDAPTRNAISCIINMRMSSYSSLHPSVKRKIPRQERGERRVAGLLQAAEAVIAETGYEAATMSAIAERAGAAIGSLYQFFPNKACITQALRTEYAKQFDRMYAPLATQARSLNPEALAGHLIELTVNFVETRPALPALLDAPHSTRVPAAMRKALRQRFASVLLAQSPRMSARKALLLGSVTFEVIKTLNKVYTDLPRNERARMVQEFKIVLLSYFCARLKPRLAGRSGATSSRRIRK